MKKFKTMNARSLSANFTNSYQVYKKPYEGRVDFFSDRKMYNYREQPYGWKSIKEYFNDDREN
jgi:hypothetical protein